MKKIIQINIPWLQDIEGKRVSYVRRCLEHFGYERSLDDGEFEFYNFIEDGVETEIGFEIKDGCAVGLNAYTYE